MASVTGNSVWALPADYRIPSRRLWIARLVFGAWFLIVSGLDLLAFAVAPSLALFGRVVGSLLVLLLLYAGALRFLSDTSGEDSEKTEESGQGPGKNELDSA